MKGRFRRRSRTPARGTARRLLPHRCGFVFFHAAESHRTAATVDVQAEHRGCGGRPASKSRVCSRADSIMPRFVAHQLDPRADLEVGLEEDQGVIGGIDGDDQPLTYWPSLKGRTVAVLFASVNDGKGWRASSSARVTPGVPRPPPAPAAVEFQHRAPSMRVTSRKSLAGRQPCMMADMAGQLRRQHDRHATWRHACRPRTRSCSSDSCRPACRRRSPADGLRQALVQTVEQAAADVQHRRRPALDRVVEQQHRRCRRQVQGVQVGAEPAAGRRLVLVQAGDAEDGVGASDAGTARRRTRNPWRWPRPRR